MTAEMRYEGWEVIPGREETLSAQVPRQERAQWVKNREIPLLDMFKSHFIFINNGNIAWETAIQLEEVSKVRSGNTLNFQVRRQVPEHFPWLTWLESQGQPRMLISCIHYAYLSKWPVTSVVDACAHIPPDTDSLSTKGSGLLICPSWRKWVRILTNSTF
jgi:hypothetical protein